MKNFVRFNLVALFVLFANFGFAAPSKSGFVLSPTLYYASTSTDDGTTSTSSSLTLLDLRLGVLMGGLYLGGIFNTNDKGDASLALNHTQYGASVGYVAGGFNFIASYLLSVEDEVSTTTKYLGTAIQADIGYSFDLGGWGMGPQFTWISYTYTKQDVSGTESDLTNDIKITSVLPKFAFWFVF